MRRQTQKKARENRSGRTDHYQTILITGGILEFDVAQARGRGAAQANIGIESTQVEA